MAKEFFALDLTAVEAEAICSIAAGRKGVALSKQYDKLVGVVGQALSNHIGVGWTGTSHTSDYTVMTALGPGSERFRGFVRNTDAFVKMCELMEITHRNPAMAPDRARQFRARLRAADDIHWA